MSIYTLIDGTSDLFTGVVAPTTCSLTICLITCVVGRIVEDFWPMWGE